MEVTLWAYEPEVVEEINRRHRNDLFLPEAPLNPSVRATGDIVDAVRGAELVVSATPSHAVREVMSAAAVGLGSGEGDEGGEVDAAVVVSASKGLEPKSHQRLSVVLASVLPAGTRIACLSGPSFAREVYQRRPTAVTVAATDRVRATRVQEALSTPYFRVYTSDDVIGVELGGALKNVIALAAGVADGLGLGHNSRAALITRGLAEMTRLGVALGARPETFAGLAGLGDLLLTATGSLSRNRSLGVALGQGRTLEEVLAERLSVAEGVNTARAALALADEVGVELPITREVARVLFEGKSPRQAIGDLMDRAPKAEHQG